MKHVHAEVIHAFADGAKIQARANGDGDERWEDCPVPTFTKLCEYRIKPAAPKWPQTTMEYEELETAYSGAGGINSWDSVAARALANAAIAHACEAGQVVPTEEANKNALEHYERGIKQGVQQEYDRNCILVSLGRISGVPYSEPQMEIQRAQYADAVARGLTK